MTGLIDKRVEVTESSMMDVVAFDADCGHVEFIRDEHGVDVEIAFEDATAAEGRELLDELEDDEHFGDDAMALARDILADIEDDTDTSDDYDSLHDDEDDEDDTSEADVVHVTEDGVEIRVGDRINNSNTGTPYEITGRDGPHVLKKRDPTDDWGITVGKVERHVRENGFASRADGSAES